MKQISEMSKEELKRELKYLKENDAKAKKMRLDDLQSRFDGCDYLRLIAVREELNRRNGNV